MTKQLSCLICTAFSCSWSHTMTYFSWHNTALCVPQYDLVLVCSDTFYKLKDKWLRRASYTGRWHRIHRKHVPETHPHRFFIYENSPLYRLYYICWESTTQIQGFSSRRRMPMLKWHVKKSEKFAEMCFATRLTITSIITWFLMTHLLTSIQL